MASDKMLEQYLTRFSRLNRAPNARLGRAPHKAILLLTLLDAVDQGLISENFVPITVELAALFRQHWETLVPPGTWREKMNLPFRHLLYEGFWELVKDGQPQTAAMIGEPSSLLGLAVRVDGGRFSSDLWMLLQEPAARTALRSQLLDTYFADAKSLPAVQPTDILAREAARLLSEAGAKFRIRRPREEEDAGAFVRHALFPSVVKNLYGQACAVCRADTRTDTGKTLLDAAHILPFAKHHNDDPRNGLALCKNHHWGFDRGWFTVAEDYKILISPHLHNTLTYLKANAFLVLPTQTECAPASDALAWHRKNKYKK